PRRAAPALPSFPTRRSSDLRRRRVAPRRRAPGALHPPALRPRAGFRRDRRQVRVPRAGGEGGGGVGMTPEEFQKLLSAPEGTKLDRKSTRLNSSHVKISYAV